jgi:hypothetical protein
MFTTKNVTTILFWIAFSAFLAMSIPHVAWVYYSYEAHNGYIPVVLSYGVAIGIDILVCWLAYLQSSKKRGDVVVTWVFIAVLAFLSWYCNYLYTMAYSPQPVTDVWNIPINIGIGYTTTGYITPIIISAIPMFVIGYTFMLGRLSSVRRETLEDKASRLEKEKVARDRIAEVSKGKFTSKIKAAISNTVDVARYAKQSLHTPSQASQEGQETPLQPEEVSQETVQPEASTDSLQPQIEASQPLQHSQASQEGQELASQPEEVLDNITQFPQPTDSLQPQIEEVVTGEIAVPSEMDRASTNGHSLETLKLIQAIRRDK